MEARSCFVLVLLVVQVVFSGQWITSAQENLSVGRKIQKMVPGNPKHFPTGSSETKRRPSPNLRDLRKKPSGHLKALSAEDMENDGVISVAIGPSPTRPKYNKTRKNQTKNNATVRNNRNNNNNVVNIVKDVLSQLGKEFLTRQVNEDFVFGQYVGNSMKNLTREIKVKMQHEILDLIVKYQQYEKNIIIDDLKQKEEDKHDYAGLKDVKMEKKSMNGINDTDEPWPDFTNLAKIVG